MHRTTLALFGGALFSAGLAHAQEFQFDPHNAGLDVITWGYAYATDIPGIGSFDRELDSNFDPASALFHVTAHYNGFSAAAQLAPHTAYVNAGASSAYGPGFGHAIAYAYFSVARPLMMYAEWYFGDEQPPFAFTQSTLVIRDETAATTLLEIAEGDADFGVTFVNLSPGRSYSFLLEAVALEPFGDTFARVELELPPCPCDLDSNAVLNLDDIILFADAFVDMLPGADIDANAVYNLDDVILFADCFNSGCP